MDIYLTGGEEFGIDSTWNQSKENKSSNKKIKKGARLLTQDERDALDDGKLDKNDMIRIMNEGTPFHPVAPPPAHHPARHWPRVEVPAPARAEIPAPIHPMGILDDRSLRLQNELGRAQLELERERLKNQRYSYDANIYNRLYNWGIGLVPDYYTYVQRKRFEETLGQLIKKELSNQKDENELEDKIKKLFQKAKLPSKRTSKRTSKSKSKRASKSKQASKKKSKKKSKK